MTSAIDGFLRSPLSGIAPWILLSVLSTPGHFEIAVCAALGLALVVLWLGHRRGIKIHALELFGVVFFAVLAVIGLLASDGVIRTLGVWAGEISNIALAVFAVGSLLVRRPFTIAYAKDTTPQEFWDTPVFKRVNYAISGVWAVAFLTAAVSGYVGDALLHDSDNFWTGWVIPLFAIFAAIAFTEFYPDHAGAQMDKAEGRPVETPTSWVKLVEWIPTFVVVVGIFGWVTDALPDVVGIAMIVAGSLAAGVIAKAFPRVDADAAG